MNKYIFLRTNFIREVSMTGLAWAFSGFLAFWALQVLLALIFGFFWHAAPLVGFIAAIGIGAAWKWDQLWSKFEQEFEYFSRWEQIYFENLNALESIVE